MEIKNKYYLIGGEHKSNVTIAVAPQGTLPSHELIPILEGTFELPFEFNLLELNVAKTGILESNHIIKTKNILLDYQPNSLAWPLMSEKLKTIIDNYLTGEEEVNWIKSVINYQDEKITYYIPRFSKMLDVLDTERTSYITGTNHIIKPVFSFRKIKDFKLFHKPSSHDLWKITPSLYVCDELKKAIQKKQITGIIFDRIIISE